MKRRLHPDSRLAIYSRWYEARYNAPRRELEAVVEFAWRFPQIVRSARWFREAVADLISVIVIDRKGHGKSFRRIASLLSRMRVPPRRADRWHASAVRLYTRRRPNRPVSALNAFRILCAIYGRQRQDRSWSGLVIRSGDVTQEDVRLLWDFHRLIKDPFKVLRRDILARFRRHERRVANDKTVPRPERLISYVRRCWGTRELPHSTLRAVLLAKGIRDHGILDDLSPVPHYRKGLLDLSLSRDDLIILVTGRLETAVTKILSQWFGISPRSAYRYKPVQKRSILGSITVTPVDSD
jgi:hypothetical protein